MRKPPGCARLGAQRQQIEREPLTLPLSAPIGPALPHHSSSPLFQLRFVSIITAAPEKTCGVRGLLGGRATQRGGGRITSWR